MKITTVTLNPAIDRTYFADSFTLGSVNRAKSVLINAGGKGINFTVALARAGADCVATGFLGFGGGVLCDTVRKENIKPEFIEIASDIRVNVKICDEEKGTFTDLNESGGAVSKEEKIRLFDKLEVLTGESDYLYMGGSLPCGMPSDTYKKIIELGKRIGAVTVLDASGEALKAGLSACPDIIKPNKDEAQALLGRKLINVKDAAEAAMEIRGKGIKTVLLSLGEQGAVAASDEGVYRANPLNVCVRGTVGAGDTFLAGYVYAQTKGFDVLSSLKYAMSFSAAKISTAGTTIPSFDKLTQYTDSVICEKII